MYTDQDYQANRLQLKKRLCAVGVPALFMLAAVVWSFFVRIKLLTIVLTIVLGSGLIFCYGLLLYPVIAYGRHIGSVLYGRTHVTQGVFKRMEDTPVLREGVSFYPLLISVGDPADDKDDRLFYYDANLPRPDWHAGDKLTLTAHDKQVGAWEAA